MTALAASQALPLGSEVTTFPTHMQRKFWKITLEHSSHRSQRQWRCAESHMLTVNTRKRRVSKARGSGLRQALTAFQVQVQDTSKGGLKTHATPVFQNKEPRMVPYDPTTKNKQAFSLSLPGNILPAAVINAM